MGDRSRFGVATSGSNRLNSSLHRCTYPLGSWLHCASRPSTHRIGCNPVRAPSDPYINGQRWPRRISDFRPSRIEPILAVIRKQELEYILAIAFEMGNRATAALRKIQKVQLLRSLPLTQLGFREYCLEFSPQ